MKKEEYYLYFDDSGIRFPDKQQLTRQDGMDYFALGGILLKKTDRDFVIQSYKALKEKWRITYPLRSSDLRGKRGNYIWLQDSKLCEEFTVDLNTFLCNIPVVGFAAVVDRIGYNKRYEAKYEEKRWWMCKTAFNILIERALKYVIGKEGCMKIRFEGTGKFEDRAIIEYAKNLKNMGMPFDISTSSKYSYLTQEQFRMNILGEPRRQEKKSPLLQIADVYLYPMVKGGYDKLYPVYKMLMENNKLIDAIISKNDVDVCGIKYSCFDK